MDFINDEDDMKEDKILNNSFNSGEINYQEFTQSIKVDNRVSALYEDQLGDVIEHRTYQLLHEEIYDIFKDSPYFEKYKVPKRVDKNDMIKMFYYFKEEIEKRETKFSPVEYFIGFAEFFQVNYDQLYKELKVLGQESVLRDFVEKNKLEDKIKTKRLF